jgi:hypothetical protein
MLLHHLRDTPALDAYELALFDWYVAETEELLSEMLSGERAYIQNQIEVEAGDVNDSALVAVDYYLKRVRYSHVIYMTSLVETFLERACGRLTKIIGAQSLPFFTTTELKGDQWSVRRKFLERYGNFTVPDEVWSDIDALTCLRNNLVHDNGYTGDFTPDRRTMLARRSGIDLSGHEVVIEAEYIRSALKAVNSLVQFIEGQLGEILNRAIRPRTIA